MTITEWMQTAYRTSQGKGFEAYEYGEAGIDRRLLLVVGELVEAQNELRNGHTPQEIYFHEENTIEYMPLPKPEGFPIELADAVLRIFNIASRYGIDLEHAITLKHHYNQTRPYKHGGKAF